MYSTVLMLACLLQIYFIYKVPVHNSSHLKKLYTIYTLPFFLLNNGTGKFRSVVEITFVHRWNKFTIDCCSYCKQALLLDGTWSTLT